MPFGPDTLKQQLLRKNSIIKMKDQITFNAQQKKVYDKQANMLTWFITESGTVSVVLQHGASENYRLTDVNGRTLEQGSLKDGRVMFIQMSRGTYTLHVSTAKGIIRREIDIQ
jgi:hypothetical protein